MEASGSLLAAAAPRPDACVGAGGSRTHFRHTSGQCFLRGAWRSGHRETLFPNASQIIVLTKFFSHRVLAGLIFLTFLFLEGRNTFQIVF